LHFKPSTLFLRLLLPLLLLSPPLHFHVNLLVYLLKQLGILLSHYCEHDMDYELTFSYQDDQNLDKQIQDILSEMHFHADLDCCFIEATITEIGTERHW
jgi:hypothetical protein